MRNVCFVVVFSWLLTGWLFATGPAAAADWPQFRGPQRDGTSTETGLATVWPQTGPQQLWRVEIGEGYSGIVVVDGRLLTMFAAGEDEVLASFDPATGKEQWRVRIGANFETQLGNGPRATPTVADGVAYALSSNGQLHAIHVADGKVLWSRDLPETLGGRRPNWGYAAPPLVDGDHLLIDAGGLEGRGFASLSRTTGEIVWTATDERNGYAAPLRLELAGRSQYVTVTRDHVLGLDPQTGTVLWQHPAGDGTIAGVVDAGEDRVFVSAPEDGAIALRIHKDGDGFRIEELWTSKRFKNHFQTSVYFEGHLYGFDAGSLKCIDAASGEMSWGKRGLGKGSLIIADGLLIILGERGQLVLAKATPESWQELASAQIFEDKSWTPPALADGRLYLRNQFEMVALDLTGE